jgi:hypothetical protein
MLSIRILKSYPTLAIGFLVGGQILYFISVSLVYLSHYPASHMQRDSRGMIVVDASMC